MLRSEEIEYISMYFHGDNVKSVIERLGESSTVQIMGERGGEFKQESVRLEQLEQKIRNLTAELRSSGKEIPVLGGQPKDSLMIVEDEVNRCHERIRFLKEAIRSTMDEEYSLEQTLKMIECSKRFVAEVDCKPGETRLQFDFLTAIVESDKKQMTKEILRHRLRRNVYINTNETAMKSSNKKHTILIVYVLGEENRTFARTIVKRLGGRVFDFDSKKTAQYSELEVKYGRTRRLERGLRKQTRQVLAEIESRVASWRQVAGKERRMVDALGKLRKVAGTDCYVGEGWILKKDQQKLDELKCFNNEKGRFFYETSKTSQEVPSHFDCSDFSQAFQNLTNVFGVPKYGEINPAIFMTFTFPFLFGAMFGDVLHGLILLAIASGLIIYHSRLDRQFGVFQIILDGRYVVLACSLAAIWFGLLYGDFGSVSIALFKSQYDVHRTYPFGIDPRWHHADNKMVFVNSLKMKLSLIIGFFHMCLGSLISIANCIHFRDSVTLFCVVIPQAVAFVLFLGYLVFLCVYKWLVTIDHPSLVNTLISMYTDPFNMKNQMYPGQLYVQLLIYSVILVCVPWMMLSKPIYLILKKRIPQDGVLDLWINSGIHTVEFCLGLISNSSSYLRLWAVSLAHVQLTSVLHEFTLGNNSIWIRLLTFPIYLAGTMMLLIGLEGLSSCLHALRLNWIEFFSKFYNGGGTLFKPLNFKPDLDEDD